MKSNTLPSIAWYLGYAGLLPFLILTLLLGLQVTVLPLTHVALVDWLLIYAATIISFLGAVHWGVALGMDKSLNAQQQNRLMGYSVLPALLAWIVILLPTHLALLGMALCIIMAYIIDRLWLFPLLNSDYARLRLHLTIVVGLCLASASLFY